jgi:hypothetical protein
MPSPQNLPCAGWPRHETDSRQLVCEPDIRSLVLSKLSFGLVQPAGVVSMGNCGGRPRVFQGTIGDMHTPQRGDAQNNREPSYDNISLGNVNPYLMPTFGDILPCALIFLAALAMMSSLMAFGVPFAHGGNIMLWWPISAGMVAIAYYLISRAIDSGGMLATPRGFEPPTYRLGTEFFAFA